MNRSLPICGALAAFAASEAARQPGRQSHEGALVPSEHGPARQPDDALVAGALVRHHGDKDAVFGDEVEQRLLAGVDQAMHDDAVEAADRAASGQRVRPDHLGVFTPNVSSRADASSASDWQRSSDST